METRKPEGEGMGGKDDLEKSCRGGFSTAVVPVGRRTAANLFEPKPNVLPSVAIRLQRVCGQPPLISPGGRFSDGVCEIAAHRENCWSQPWR